VDAINFDRDEPNRPISAQWTSKNGTHGTIAFDWLVDASGRTGIMSTKYLKNRKFNKSLKNIAYWAYWAGGGIYAPGTKRENAPWFEALTGKMFMSMIGCMLKL
jgi:flavine halogenase